MAEITDIGIVTLYDRDGDGTPVRFHRIDANEALKHPSKRWLTSPPTQGAEQEQGTIGSAAPLTITPDSGAAMKLKETKMNSLRAIAKQKDIPDYGKMTKAELVDALILAGVE
jgi:hypothetical protein